MSKVTVTFNQTHSDKSYIQSAVARCHENSSEARIYTHTRITSSFLLTDFYSIPQQGTQFSFQESGSTSEIH
jgi:hypothetical protein